MIFHEYEVRGGIPQIRWRWLCEYGVPIAFWIRLGVTITVEAMRVVGGEWSMCVIREMSDYSHIIACRIGTAEI